MEIIEAGYNAVIVDNLHNSSMEAVRRIEAIVGKPVPFENADLTNLDEIKAVFAKYPIDSVIHFAALKVIFLYYGLVDIGCWRELSNSIGILSRQHWRDDQFD